MTTTYKLLSTEEVLKLKIEIRETRAKHAKGTHKQEELRVLAELKAKLAAL